MSRRLTILAIDLAVGALLLTAIGFAQQGGQKGAPKANAKAPAPPLLDCGVHGDLEVICGVLAPEDIEVTPDKKFLITTQMATGARPAGVPSVPLMLFDIQKKTFSPLPVTNLPTADWGDQSCTEPIGDALVSHGSSLVKRKGGAWQLYVTNHGKRQSIEMFELKKAGNSWTSIWRGCVLADPGADYNDVAALPDGGFIATRPTALQAANQGKGKGGGGGGLQPGAISGNLSRWSRISGQVVMPGTELAYPNGVLVSDDLKTMLVPAWTASEVAKFDLTTGKKVGTVKLTFQPDNATWMSNGHILAAGIRSTGGTCGATPCIQQFGIADIDPKTMTAKVVYESEGQSPISGVSSAIEVGKAIYVGAFQGDRIVKINRK